MPLPHRSRSARVAVAVALTLVAPLACSREAAKSESATADRVTMSPAAPMRARRALAEAPPAPVADQANLSVAQGIGGANGAVADSAAVTASPASADDPTAGAMLVRTGVASVQVDSLTDGMMRVRGLARRVGAVVANVAVQAGGEQNRSASLELRIPSARFDEVVNSLAPIGKVESVNVSVEDVGEEYVDVAARMANARRLEERLIQLLAARTGRLRDVLEVEHELARVREEIERYEGRMRYLRTRTATSRLTVTVHEPLPLVADHPGERPIRDAFVQAWRNFVALVASLIASLGILLPLGAIVVALVLVGRRFGVWRRPAADAKA